MRVKKIKRKIIRLFKRKDVRGGLELILSIGAICFGVLGSMMLALGTDTPMMAVASNSMKHEGVGRLWRNYFLDRGIDPSGFPIQGGFEEGDLLVLQGIRSPEDVRVGDVIVYRSEPTPITHRVADVRREDGRVWYVTKGDRNPTLDNDPVEPDQVMGKVVFVIPKLGYVSLYRWVFGILIVSLLLVMWVVRRG